MRKYFIYEESLRMSSLESFEFARESLLSKSISQNQCKDFIDLPNSNYRNMGSFVALLFFSCGLLALVKPRLKRSALFCVIMLYGRCNWVYGNYWLYDLDVMIPRHNSFMLMIKYLSGFGALMLMYTRGKIRGEKHNYVWTAQKSGFDKFRGRTVQDLKMGGKTH